MNLPPIERIAHLPTGNVLYRCSRCSVKFALRDKLPASCPFCDKPVIRRRR